MTIIELVVAAGLMSLVAAGVAAAIYQVTANQNEISRKFDGGDFVANLGRSVADRAQCKTFLTGTTLPAGADFVPLVLKGYKGFGDSAGADIKSGHIISGTPSNPQIVVSDLSWKVKEAASLDKTFNMTKNGVTAAYIKPAMQIRVSLQVFKNGKAETLPYRYLDYHVIAVAANRTVTDCDGASTVADTCAMLGIPQNADGTCKISNEGCVIRGSYVKSFCSPTGYTCRATTSSPSKVHPETKDYTCPAGSAAFSSFNHTWTSEEQTGKKSDTTVTNTIQAYMCMSCQ